MSVISLVDSLIAHALQSRASDIHLEPSDDGVRVRVRVDGVLEHMCLLPRAVEQEVVARIKVLAHLRTDEHQATQDGRIRHISEGETIDIRVSVVPSYHGETVVLRLLTDNAGLFSLDSFGFREGDRKTIERAIRRPSGMILVTGPTGSGKTSTLYAFLKLLNTSDVSIITIEDPIEYAIPSVTQVQVNAKTGLTFATGLRSMLRQDPNIIMVGEIRDMETASIAVHTALTGHLLLTTLHTSDASTTLPRLMDMGVDPYLIATTMSLSIGQRLLRRLCPECKVAVEISSGEEELFAPLPLGKKIRAGEILYRARGCDLCGGIGYRGRLCINEVLTMDDSLRSAVMGRAPASEIKKRASKNGMTPMLEDGVEKARRGETTLEEVLKIVYE